MIGFDELKNLISARTGTPIDLVRMGGSNAFAVGSVKDYDIIGFTNEIVPAELKHFYLNIDNDLPYDIYIRDAAEQDKIRTFSYDHPYIVQIFATFDQETADYMHFDLFSHKQLIIRYIRRYLREGVFSPYRSEPSKRVMFPLALMYKFENGTYELTAVQQARVAAAYGKQLGEDELKVIKDYFGVNLDFDALLTEAESIRDWFVRTDYYPHKIVTGEWDQADPRWLDYLHERQIKRARQDEIAGLLGEQS